MNDEEDKPKESAGTFNPVNISFWLAGTGAFFVTVALFYAPLAYGCTRASMLPVLFALLTAALVAGALGFTVSRDWWSLPPLPVICITAILIQGWWMTWDPVFPSLVAASGGVVSESLAYIQHLSFDSMAVTSLLLCSFLLLYELFDYPHLRRFILLAAAISGAFISIIGVVLKLSGAPLMHYFWKPEDIDWNDFAFYRYHGNAGAFLNLVWPLILVFTRRAYSPGGALAKKIIWTFCSLACASGLFLNASKAALVIGLLILPWPFLSWLAVLNRKTLLILCASCLVLIAGGLVASSQMAQEVAIKRLANASEVSASLTARLEAYEQYLNALPEIGAFGLGPGLFQLGFPYGDSPLGNVRVGLREFAHEDYLQTLLEWGWLGSLWWVLLVGGGLYRAVRCYFERDWFASKTERHLLLAAILGVVATLSQSLIDFPLQVASIRLYFLVFLAFCWAAPKLLTVPPPTEEEIPQLPRKRYRLVIPADLPG